MAIIKSNGEFMTMDEIEARLKASDESEASQPERLAPASWLAARRETTKLRKNLKDLVTACEWAIAALDQEMKKHSDYDRGKRVAKITNYLEMSKDSAAHFGLGKRLRPKRSSAAKHGRSAARD